MENLQALPNQQNINNEPNSSEQQLTKEEIEKQIKYYWKEIELATSYIPYKEAFERLDYYRDLKLKLYK